MQDRLVDKLYQLVVKGDETAGEQLVAHLRERFVLLARRRIGAADAEDIAQEACMTIHEKLRLGSRPELFEAWAYQILRNKIGNYLRSNRRKTTESLDTAMIGENPGFSEESIVLKTALRRCLASMQATRPAYLRVLNLTQHGFSTTEICKKLKVTPNNLYVMLNRSRKMLRECLEKGGRLT